MKPPIGSLMTSSKKGNLLCIFDDAVRVITLIPSTKVVLVLGYERPLKSDETVFTWVRVASSDGIVGYIVANLDYAKVV